MYSTNIQLEFPAKCILLYVYILHIFFLLYLHNIAEARAQGKNVKKNSGFIAVFFPRKKPWNLMYPPVSLAEKMFYKNDAFTCQCAKCFNRTFIYFLEYKTLFLLSIYSIYFCHSDLLLTYL